MDYSGLVAD